jgi:hypothetical protein
MVSRQETFETHAALKLRDSHMGEIHGKAIVFNSLNSLAPLTPLAPHPLPVRAGFKRGWLRIELCGGQGDSYCPQMFFLFLLVFIGFFSGRFAVSTHIDSDGLFVRSLRTISICTAEVETIGLPQPFLAPYTKRTPDFVVKKTRRYFGDMEKKA